MVVADPFKKPDEPKPTDPKPGDPKGTEPKPDDPKPVEVAKPVETKPAENALPRIEGSVVFIRKKDVLFGNTTSTVKVMVKSGSPAGSGCDVHLPNGTHKLFGTLRPGDNQESDAASWPRDPRPDPNKAQKWVLVECRDAAGYFDYSDIVRK